jgi:hypothetical protein
MKQMAVIDDQNKVVNIIVCNDEEQETANLITYSDNNPAYINGYFVDGYFYSPKPFDSWTGNQGLWNPPTPYPTDGFTYLWNEANLSWELQDFSEPNE